MVTGTDIFTLVDKHYATIEQYLNSKYGDAIVSMKAVVRGGAGLLEVYIGKQPYAMPSNNSGSLVVDGKEIKYCLYSVGANANEA